MSGLILSLVPLAVAASVQPAQVMSLLLLLQAQRGAAKALAYIAGMIAFRLALGGASWVLVSGVETTVESSGGKFSILVGNVLAILGLLMLVYGLRRAFFARPDEDQAAASWLDKLDSISSPQAFLVGLAFLALDPKDWITDISAVNLIADADLSGHASLLTYLVYILLAQGLLLVMLILAIAVPQQAEGRLAALNTWMKRNERAIEVIVAILFGLLFLYIGFERLGIL